MNLKLFMYCYNMMRHYREKQEHVVYYKKKAWYAFLEGFFKSGMYFFC